MTSYLLLAALAAGPTVPATAQNHAMSGMTMPMPPAKDAATPPPPPAHQAHPNVRQTPPGSTDQRMSGMDHGQMDHGGMDQAGMAHGAMAMPAFTAPAAWQAAAVAASAKAPAGAPPATMTMGAGGGWYQMGSGTARLPAGEGPMRGAMIHAGDWMLMAHGYAWGVATEQGGPRGGGDAFVGSMAMLMADRDLGDRLHLQLRAMGSLEPAMGPQGYRNLFATGEVADGRPLVDRQHPHDLFMELSARLDARIGGNATAFVYAAPVGEPALGPSAFMHRASARYLPMAPITHHWFDSTHITYGVVTGGYAGPRVQLEASAFRGREPDEHRWDIERPKLDSWSVRGSWTPSPFWALQLSHGRLESPEEQHPGEDEARTTASIGYARGGLAVTAAWARKRRLPADAAAGPILTAWLGEATWEIDRRHAIFGRVENVDNDELFPVVTDPRHDIAYRVTKAEGGYAYRLPIAGPFGVAIGGTVAVYGRPRAIADAYGSPVSGTLFAKLALGL